MTNDAKNLRNVRDRKSPRRTLVVGIDVGKLESRLCVLNAKGSPIAQFEVKTSTQAFIDALRPYKNRIRLIGFEATAMSEYLCIGLQSDGYPAILINANHASTMMREIKRNKTDANDAYALAELLRRSAYREVWVKSPAARRRFTLLSTREALLKAEKGLANCIDSNLLSEGTAVRRKAREQYVGVLAPLLESSRSKEQLQPLLRVLKVLNKAITGVNRTVHKQSKICQVSKLLMTVPSIGPITSNWFFAVIDDPNRFKSARSVGPFLGLTRATRQSAKRRWRSPRVRAGAAELRSSLYMCARTAMYHTRKVSRIGSWGHNVAVRRGSRLAIVAVAGKLAVVMMSVWKRGKAYQ